MKSSIIPSDGVFDQPADEPSLLAQLGRKALFATLSRLQHGEVCVIEPHARRSFGSCPGTEYRLA